MPIELKPEPQNNTASPAAPEPPQETPEQSEGGTNQPEPKTAQKENEGLSENQLSRLRRQEARTNARAERVARELEEQKAKLTDYETKAEKLARIEKLLESDPQAALREFGMDMHKLVKNIARSDAPVKTEDQLRIEKLEKTIEDEKAAKAKQEEDAKQEQAAALVQQTKQVVTSFLGKLDKELKEDTSLELARSRHQAAEHEFRFPGADGFWKVTTSLRDAMTIADEMAKHGPVDPKQVVKMLEDYYMAEAEEVISVDKVKKKVLPEENAAPKTGMKNNVARVSENATHASFAGLASRRLKPDSLSASEHQPAPKRPASRETREEKLARISAKINREIRGSR